ncbi:metallophosphatase domain-containing protein [uncultured Proteiniphilum sp.]|uniref:metallophosphatase domain-containing protein n=1 Tax=uncultured Proteiniphilum sp. TaxID=497637 RepID=UPI00262DF96A|nr:metallophosphatase domain-containing protein [uncultured Proteiniphilum sp.]
MRILHLSDTHNRHHQLVNMSEADLIVHSGDISFAGSEDEAIDFIRWFSALPYKYKVFIAGNHDNCLHGANIDGLPENCFYLCDSSIMIDGLKFYGVPMFMEDAISGNYDESIQKIPDDTDILITHQPPYGVLDNSANIHYGDHNLLQTVLDIRPRYHLFGHIHNVYGVEKGKNTIFSNASLVDEQYRLLNKPFLFDI